MKSRIVFAIKSLFVIGVGVFFSFFVYSCKTQSAAQTEKTQRTKVKEGHRNYRDAYQQHWKNQDKDTKKRMEKKKKDYKPRKKDKRYPCPNSNPDSQHKVQKKQFYRN